MNNEELQSRREFFKRAAKGALPVIAVSLVGPSILTSCGNPNEPVGDCKGCSGKCKGECTGNCDNKCTAKCKNTSSIH